MERNDRLFFSKVGNFQFILNCDSNKQDLMNHFKCIQIPPYYKEMVYYWIDLKQSIETDSKVIPQCNVENENIWFNSNVKSYDGNVLFYKRWFDRGILKIKDLLRNSEFMSLREVEALFEKKTCYFIF